MKFNSLQFIPIDSPPRPLSKQHTILASVVQGVILSVYTCPPLASYKTCDKALDRRLSIEFSIVYCQGNILLLCLLSRVGFLACTWYRAVYIRTSWARTKHAVQAFNRRG